MKMISYVLKSKGRTGQAAPPSGSAPGLGLSQLGLGLFLCLIIFCLAAGQAQARVGRNQCRDIKARSGGIHFVQWSDLHLADGMTVESEWEQALEEGLASDPQFLVFTGDISDNKCSESEFDRRSAVFTEKYAPRMLAGGKPILFAYGNNDFYKNYCTDPDNLLKTQKQYKKAFKDKFYLNSLGNGVCPQDIAGMRWITINSLVFSSSNSYDRRAEQAEQTLLWLQRALRKVPEGHAAVVLSHISPTYDVYNNCTAWDEPYLEKYMDILAHSGVKVITLSGHFHRNEQHVLDLGRYGVSPVLDCGGISRKYSYKPSYRIFDWELNSQGVPTKLTWNIRFVGQPSWNETISVPQPFQLSSWLDLWQRQSQDEQAWRSFMAAFWSHSDYLENELTAPCNRQIMRSQFVTRRGEFR